MADFDLTQTDQQVQNILNDAQGAMGASAQTTLTTEYVMLKDTSGIYHKILKSSFTEAIRDVLAGLLVNNDKGTTINQIAAIASGDFGSITPANLASVLGGLEYAGEINSSNIANVKVGVMRAYFYPWNSQGTGVSGGPGISAKSTNTSGVLLMANVNGDFFFGVAQNDSGYKWFKLTGTQV